MSNVTIYDQVLEADVQRALYDWLSGPGWSYAACSGSRSDSSRYRSKRLAGAERLGDSLDPESNERVLARHAPLVSLLWTGLKERYLAGHQLTRCYASGYRFESEVGVHRKALDPNDNTVIFHPHLVWDPNWGGETLLFNETETDVVASVKSKPNRLLVFTGNMPYAERPTGRSGPKLWITLTFNTVLVT